MKGIIVPKQGGEPELSTDLQVPEPGEGQVLVKSIYTAINPVDTFMIQMALLVEKWPLVPGCDAGGVIVKTGPNAISPLGGTFKEGDKVFGCTRLGFPGYGPYQEYFLMDAVVTFPVPKNVTLDGACTLGVAADTAGLAIFDCLSVPVPDPGKLPEPKDDWALVLGASSSVGKCAIQIFKACGFKVIGSGSPSSFEMIKSFGADECVSYKQPQEEMIAEIAQKTEGKLHRIFDAVAQHIEVSTALFEPFKNNGEKWFTSTDDWTPMPETKDFKARAVSLGPVGRPNADVNAKITSYIPFFCAMIEAGKITPSPYIQIGNLGVENVIEAYDFQKSGKGGNKKVIVHVAEE